MIIRIVTWTNVKFHIIIKKPHLTQLITVAVQSGPQVERTPRLFSEKRTSRRMLEHHIAQGLLFVDWAQGISIVVMVFSWLLSFASSVPYAA